MKRIATALLLSLFLSAPMFAHDEYEQEQEHTSNRSLKISVDGMYALFGAFFAQGEFRVTDHMSILARLGYIDTRWTINSNINQLSGPFFGNDGYGTGNVALGGRWYWEGGCMEGFLIEDYVNFEVSRSFSGNDVPYLGSFGRPWVFALKNSIHVGYSWVTDIGLFFDVLAGIETRAEWGIPTQPTFAEMNTLEARMNVGWTF